MILLTALAAVACAFAMRISRDGARLFWTVVFGVLEVALFAASVLIYIGRIGR